MYKLHTTDLCAYLSEQKKSFSKVLPAMTHTVSVPHLSSQYNFAILPNVQSLLQLLKFSTFKKEMSILFIYLYFNFCYSHVFRIPFQHSLILLRKEKRMFHSYVGGFTALSYNRTIFLV